MHIRDSKDITNAGSENWKSMFNPAVKMSVSHIKEPGFSSQIQILIRFLLVLTLGGSGDSSNS